MVPGKLITESNAPFTRALLDPVVPALTVGSFTGASGLIFGIVTGSLRSAHPALFAAFSGAQWFGLGTTFWYTRSAIASATSSGDLSRTQGLGCSTVAGSLTGGINGAFRSRSNIVPGAIVLGVLGFAGQFGYNVFSAKEMVDLEQRSMLQRFAEMKWSPLKALPNEKYERMLSEQLLSTEAEIAIIDEKIAALLLAQSRSSQEENRSP